MASIGSAKAVRSLLSSRLAPVPPVHGIATAGSDIAERIRRLGRRGLPPYPDGSIVPELTIPAPAQVPADADAYEMVHMCSSAYGAVLRLRYDLPCRFMRGAGKLGSHKLYQPVLQAAHALRDLQIPPVAWVLFSADVWRDGVGTTPPSATWVFSHKRIVARSSWFDGLRPTYCARRVTPSPRHTQLLRDWSEMWRELVAADPVDRGGVLDVVDHHFPADAYERKVQSARSEVARMQREVDETIAGGSLWVM